jgi:YgiT-type zinc finger domain-containing protein
MMNSEKLIPQMQKNIMKCHVCGSGLESVETDLPFKVSELGIIIIKDLPVLQCGNCREYLIDDKVMAQVEKILEQGGDAVELEVVRFAA